MKALPFALLLMLTPVLADEAKEAPEIPVVKTWQGKDSAIRGCYSLRVEDETSWKALWSRHAPKEKVPDVVSGLVNGGVYAMSQSIFDHMPAADAFSLEHDVFPNLIDKGAYGYVTESDVIDIGTPERYHKANDIFSKQMPMENLPQTDGPIKLHIGCGEEYLDGYVNIDHPPSEHTVMKVKADIYADIATLDFPENSIDEVRSHHLFEHFTRPHALRLLFKWRRWLKPGGTLVIETPDFENCARAYVFAVTYKRKMELGRHIFGSQEAAWANHLDFWDKEKFRYVLKKAGFKKIRVREFHNGLARHFQKFPLAIMNIVGNIMPSLFYKTFGGNKLPSILVRARKNGSVTLDEKMVARVVLSQYLVGKEGGALLDVWMRDFEA